MKTLHYVGIRAAKENKRGNYIFVKKENPITIK